MVLSDKNSVFAEHIKSSTASVEDFFEQFLSLALKNVFVALSLSAKGDSNEAQKTIEQLIGKFFMTSKVRYNG